MSTFTTPLVDGNQKSHHQKPVRVGDRLAHMGQALDDHLEAGTLTLAALKKQRSVLKGARSRALDMASSLGVSQTLIRWIDLRAKQDSVLFYSGIIFSIALLVFLYIYFL
ncbi:Golgi SNAP receptor complex member 2 [Mitosporidium daphniae]|uniref:Membrin n=1 Tax=Mitosporidium daphniae TaxID=1485682 RepID=A0A098VLZ2_9MICR|nr:membrin [Mitosporidium daphniae]KGG50122.1 membrin [Mitosporidium daphniae]|eukprot:XP_013236558.1 membrin [Mitosporidium daphniae]